MDLGGGDLNRKWSCVQVPLFWFWSFWLNGLRPAQKGKRSMTHFLFGSRWSGDPAIFCLPQRGATCWQPHTIGPQIKPIVPFGPKVSVSLLSITVCLSPIDLRRKRIEPNKIDSAFYCFSWYFILFAILEWYALALYCDFSNPALNASQEMRHVS